VVAGSAECAALAEGIVNARPKVRFTGATIGGEKESDGRCWAGKAIVRDKGRTISLISLRKDLGRRALCAAH
jgi:hypothetical protein